jgi:hypothetical protein
MNVREIEELLDETRKLPRAADKVAQHMAIGVLEIARQLAVLNERENGGGKKSPKKK